MEEFRPQMDGGEKGRRVEAGGWENSPASIRLEQDFSPEFWFVRFSSEWIELTCLRRVWIAGFEDFSLWFQFQSIAGGDGAGFFLSILDWVMAGLIRVYLEFRRDLSSIYRRFIIDLSSIYHRFIIEILWRNRAGSGGFLRLDSLAGFSGGILWGLWCNIMTVSPRRKRKRKYRKKMRRRWGGWRGHSAHVSPHQCYWMGSSGCDPASFSSPISSPSLPTTSSPSSSFYMLRCGYAGNLRSMMATGRWDSFLNSFSDSLTILHKILHLI